MNILNFKKFESYLESSRGPLYHTIGNEHHLEDILKSDIIKPGSVARGPNGICFSRSINWTNQLSNDFRIVFDSDILIRS